MAQSSLVIENTEGQVVRTINWQQDQLIVYLNLDTGRVDFVSSKSELNDFSFPYEILAETNRRSLEKQAISIARRGQIRMVKEVGETVSLVSLQNDNPEEIKAISKWTAITHGVLALLLLIGSFFIGRMETKTPQVVTVFHQKDLIPPTVKATEKKIVKQTYKARVSNRTVKPKTKTFVSAKKTTKIRTQVNLSKVGALGALGGMANGKKGSAGFNPNAKNASLGTSLKDIGSQGAGGFERAVHGKGLVSSSVGTGGFGAGQGYATRGKGGGRPGYGTMSMVGGSSGYFLPLEDEALIEGGLDKDQIAAVIQRHLGEVIYCYEKGLQVQPKLAGRVGINFVIGCSGRVSSARISQSSLKSSSVESCIVNRLKSWGFPKPYGGVNVKVSYPFVLRRVG